MEKREMRKLAEFIEKLSWDDLPEEVKTTVSFRVLDLISAALGAVNDPQIKKVKASYLERNNGTGGRIWGSGEETDISTAAFINAMLAHTLELDDVHPASKTHGSASLIPAAWSCAKYVHASGKEFLTAVVCGYETVSRIGMALGVTSHRKKGWHATATCGGFGCAAACGKLLGLNAEKIVSALGMAGTQSFGRWAFLGDGSTCKVLHPARAAVNGLDAAFLAKTGMTGPEHILEAEDGGLLVAMSDAGDIGKISEGLGTKWEILYMDMKPYPCCRSAHCAIDGSLRLRKMIMEESEDPAEEVKKVEIGTYEVGYKQCAVSDGCLHPKNTMDAKFSTPFCTASALIYGKVTGEEFKQSVVDDKRVKELIEKIHVTADERFTAEYPAHWGCSVKVILNNGHVLETEVKDPAGSADSPLTKEQILGKAESLIKIAYPGKEKQIAMEVLDLAEADQLPEL